MPYKVGISSGFWRVARDPVLLGLAQKAGGFGATGGVQFNQIDLETTSEFVEPRLKENLRKVQQELGVEVGLHAEIGEYMGLESSQRRIWDQSHLRLIETLKNCVNLGIIYINIHLSASQQLLYLEDRYRMTGYYTPCCNFDGKPLSIISDQFESVKRMAIHETSRTTAQIVHGDDAFQRIYREYKKELEDWARKREKELIDELRRTPEYQGADDNGKRFMEEQAKRVAREEANQKEQEDLPDLTYKGWTAGESTRYLVDTGEIGAYLTVAQYMIETHDPLWTNIVGTAIDPFNAYNVLHPEFNAAVACRYIEGHLKVKDNPYNKKYLNGMSIVEFLNKHSLRLLFENPEAEQTQEGLYKLYEMKHAYQLMRKINSPKVMLCIDFEHMLAQRVDLNDPKVWDEVPNDFGKHLFLIHMGEPKPYWGTAHIPLQMGSQAQEVLYEWLFKLRKKGFKNGYIIFERGSGRAGKGSNAFEVFENSVWVIRQFAKYLDMETPTDKLPPEFFGISEQNVERMAMQRVAIKDHAWDPLQGLFMIPEEKHTFLSRSAVNLGKREEWEKGKYR